MIELHPRFRETGKAMLMQWNAGLRDIQPDVKVGMPGPFDLTEGLGLSDVKRTRKPANPYGSENGPMNSKIR